MAGGIVDGLFGGGNNPQQTESAFRQQIFQRAMPELHELNIQKDIYGQKANEAANNLFTNFSNYGREVGQFNAPQASNSLDAFHQNIVSQGSNQLLGQAAQAKAGAARQFGNNPMLARILGQQAQTRAGLQANPLMFQAAAAQKASDGQKFQQALASSQEQSRLRGERAGYNQLGNQAIGQQLGIRAQPLQNQQNLLGVLQGLASAVPAAQKEKSKAAKFFDPFGIDPLWKE